MSMSSPDDGQPSHLTPEAEERFLRRRRIRRIVYTGVSAAVLIASLLMVARLDARDVPRLRVVEVLALGFTLGGLINAVVGVVQLVSVAVDLRAVRIELAELRRTGG